MILIGEKSKKTNKKGDDKDLLTKSCGVAFSGDKIINFLIERDKSGNLNYAGHLVERSALFALNDDWAESPVLERALGRIRKFGKRGDFYASFPEEYSIRMLGFASVISRGVMASTIHRAVVKMAPLSEDDILYDYTLLAETDGGTSFVASIVPAPYAKVIRKVFADEDINLKGIDVESEALAAAYIKNGANSARFIVHIEDEKCIIALVHNGIVISSKAVNFGAGVIRRGMQESFNVSEEDVRFVLESGEFALERDSELYQQFMAGVELIINEIKEMMIEYGSYDGAYEINEVILSGSGAHLARDFADFFAAGLKLKVAHGNVWTNIVLPKGQIPPIPFKQSLEFAIPIGLALLGFRQ